MNTLKTLAAASVVLLGAGLVSAEAVKEQQKVPIPIPIYVLKIDGFITPAGVAVRSVERGGPASQIYLPAYRINSTLEPGDVIVSIEGQPIRSRNDYFRALASNGGGSVSMRVKNIRGGYVTCVAWPVSQ